MAKPVIMPKFGMTQEEATLVTWRVKEGDRVEQGDPLCEVTTDKVNMEVESPASGIVSGIRCQEGDTVPVTQVIATILSEGETATPPPAAPPAHSATPSQTTVQSTPLARRMAAAENVNLAAVPASGSKGRVTRQDVQAVLQARSAPTPASSPVPGKVPASPAARRLAAERQVDLTQVPGTGADGRVQGWDVTAWVAQKEAIAAEKTSPEAGQTERSNQTVVIPLKGMRLTIARRLQASYQQAPHIFLTVDIDMGAAIALRGLLQSRVSLGQAPVSLTAIIAKACAAALGQHPLLNSYLFDDRIELQPEINLGVAVALEDGLIVPVIHQAAAKGIFQVAGELADLTHRAREARLRPEEVADGTFTISNLGMYGVDQFTAIINPPQVAILAVGRVSRRFVPDEAGRPVAREMMSVTLSVDHRAVDGVAGARFLATLRAILETAGSQWG